ncbi:DUF1801 domain-containing protein [Motilimonas sp. 1_MG-2023]|uniref:DUF1801 domain-containing protein n=1 Tax=Motilimonas TaxID=1914248 RepID=UPI0026E2A10C|nr:DUF1801 domain-containing protein [Motilimonas sp. 1_MG-2023]MDO6527773.1 DUF1801 domain-containing protein [Motilimonas sp. 1_MG-2023]
MPADVQDKFNDYPSSVKPKLLQLRAIIFELCQQHQLGKVEESLKWGEPSYAVKHGSPVRFDWKANHPDHYCLFFNCNTTLVDTFRELYSAHGNCSFQGNRAMLLPLNQPLPEALIRQCLLMALTYHKIKHLPLLGA